MDTNDAVRRFWDEDAAHYDRAITHHPRDAAEQAAWTAALERLLPPPPARVLDAGAGTGFISLPAARLGHRVTALDLSSRMLDRLRAKAAAEGLDVELIEGSADDPPSGPYDAVIERHLIWTLPDPGQALAAWRKAGPEGRLVLFESLWGSAADPAEQLRQRARETLRRMRRVPPEHHASYDPAIRDALPLGQGTGPSALIELAVAAGWGPARFERLRDVEWAAARSLDPLARLLGVIPRFAVIGGAAGPAAA
ncbi:MAG: class I SAM-dependent methyltransferase [Acidimicrobiia bacterium]